MYPHYANILTAMTCAIVAVRGRSLHGHAVRDCEPVTGPFYLTGVPANGSATYPIFTATVSRGVLTLSSAISYFDQWTYNTTDHRIYIAGTTTGNAEQQTPAGVVFGPNWAVEGYPYGDDGLFSLVTDESCETYLVVTGSDSVYGWWGEPTDDDALPKTMLWYGSGGGANGAVRIGTSNATVDQGTKF